MLTPHQASFRDPSGYVCEDNGRILRVLSKSAATEYEAARDSGVYSDLVSNNKLVGLSETNQSHITHIGSESSYVLEHPRLPFISYPYEWSFSLLKDAAIFHLDLYLELLSKGFTLSDSSAYNVQFVGSKPVFIDHLSIRRYKEGEFWSGHRQFFEQFLIPLLMRSVLGVSHNSWFRGNLDGISVDDFAKLLRPRHLLSWNILTHIFLQSRLQQRAVKSDVKKIIKERKLPLSAFTSILKQLRKWIANMTPHQTNKTTWGNYATCNTYSSEETTKKRQFIADFLANSNVKNLIDLGCNTGEYSKVA